MPRAAIVEAPSPVRRYARAKKICELLDIAPSTLWRWVKIGRFPKPYQLGPRATCWDLNEVEALIQGTRAPQP